MSRMAMGSGRAMLGSLVSLGAFVLLTGCETSSTSEKHAGLFDTLFKATEYQLEQPVPDAEAPKVQEKPMEEKAMEAQAAPAPVQEERVAEAQVAPAPSLEPAPMAPAPQSVAALPGSLSLYFDFDQALPRLNARGEASLKALAEFLQQHDDRQLVIAGYADERGTEAYNLTLGEKRAIAVKELLESQGVKAKQLETTSFGKDKPVCKSHKPTCWKKNRRAHLAVK
jgi:peptidoglycan-associated lipoprotein